MIMKHIQQLHRRDYTSRILAVLSAFLAIVLIGAAWATGLVPIKYLVVFGVISMIVAAAIIIFAFTNILMGRKKIAAIIFMVLTITVDILLLVGLWWVVSVIDRTTSESSIVKKDIPASMPFNVYISGIDTYGDINTVSRSDVNIVATVNPKTQRILLTTIPRDSYVQIAGGGNNQYDKLTHSGIYGIDSSVQTVAHLLNIDMTTYIRVNFTSLVKIVDRMNGIKVYNPVAFKTDSGKVFQKGWIYLNGNDALQFSRERHNLKGGDSDRGVNQQRVIAGIFDKMTNRNILGNYVGFINLLSNSMQTNLSQKSIRVLVNQLLSDSGYWKVESQSISGTGVTGKLPSYAMPGSRLYMFILDDASLLQAKTRIDNALIVTQQ